jgi:hypothetical protein
MIKIPDFKKMTDAKLHGWEFVIYETLGADDNRGLIDIIGRQKTNEYYNERGRRIDMRSVVDLKKEIRKLTKELEKAERRLANNRSGKRYFGGFDDHGTV